MDRKRPTIQLWYDPQQVWVLSKSLQPSDSSANAENQLGLEKGIVPAETNLHDFFHSLPLSCPFGIPFVPCPSMSHSNAILNETILSSTHVHTNSHYFPWTTDPLPHLNPTRASSPWLFSPFTYEYIIQNTFLLKTASSVIEEQKQRPWHILCYQSGSNKRY